MLTTLLQYLQQYAHIRLASLFQESGQHTPPKSPKFKSDNSPFAAFLQNHQPNAAEQLLLALAITPHVQPHFFDDLIRQFMPQGGNFPQIGGTRGTQFRGFLPTGETALFLLGGDDLAERARIQQLLGPDNRFVQQKILWVEDVPFGEPAMSGRLIMAPEYVELFTTGRIIPPRFSTSFPAEKIETQLDWSDLVLNPQTLDQIQELNHWLQHHNNLDATLRKRLKPGYKILFWGPPGTGKTLTAGLLGKQNGRDVFRIDLSMLVSKFIGETEKNLSNLFDKAENKDWILFFDEADALFGKRTGIRDAHDKYANQEVSYLLQRVEHYNGLIILASNFKTNIDDAFMRRFQNIIHFPMPRPAERLKLWQQSIPDSIKPADAQTILSALAQKFEMSGAAILNVVQFASLRALAHGHQTLQEVDLREGIIREFAKEGKVVG